MDTLSEPVAAKNASVPNVAGLNLVHNTGQKPALATRASEAPKYLISIVTVALLLALWAVATHQGWIKPLFLPAPEAIGTAIGQAINGELDG